MAYATNIIMHVYPFISLNLVRVPVDDLFEERNTFASFSPVVNPGNGPAARANVAPPVFVRKWRRKSCLLDDIAGNKFLWLKETNHRNVFNLTISVEEGTSGDGIFLAGE
jgi:hypothetical protein